LTYGGFSASTGTFFEAQSLNSVAIQPYPASGNYPGMPANTAYDMYGYGVTVLSGTAQVRVRYYNGCAWSSWSSTFSLASCAARSAVAANYVLSPDPAQASVTVSLAGAAAADKTLTATESASSQGGANIKQIKIYDVTGKLRKQQAYDTPKTSKITLDISSLPPGIYMVEISDGISSVTKKLVVQR
jgi:hypothetical protein